MQYLTTTHNGQSFQLTVHETSEPRLYNPNAIGYNLWDVYARGGSLWKQQAFEKIKAECKEIGGRNLRITGACSMQFSTAYDVTAKDENGTNYNVTVIDTRDYKRCYIKKDISEEDVMRYKKATTKRQQTIMERDEFVNSYKKAFGGGFRWAMELWIEERAMAVFYYKRNDYKTAKKHEYAAANIKIRYNLRFEEDEEEEEKEDSWEILKDAVQPAGTIS